MMLREIGAPFELRLVDRATNAQKSAEYLRLNPNGRIPVLIDGDLVLYRNRRGRAAPLRPPLGSGARAGARHARALALLSLARPPHEYAAGRVPGLVLPA